MVNFLFKNYIAFLKQIPVFKMSVLKNRLIHIMKRGDFFENANA